ncbi:DNA-3-methyladenine glycosylase [Pseudogracilibacillus sp. SO30301A]|uniref:DNA-3-methyladenine glycosylase n=1 Tax=Pseudogracilibacillus sp. SO30301A TaxID=3098291 RepID=UPI00300E234B
MKPLDKSYYQAPCLELAQQLLGCFLVHEISDQKLVGRIVETEAYRGSEDRAAHSYRNRRTKRTEVMFQEAGLVYTYQMHSHTLLNIVAGQIGTPHAVLIRAIEPAGGIEQMKRNRGETIKEIDLTNGPGKLTKALGITMNHYGHDISKKPLYIVKGTPIGDIATSPRVGVRNTGEAANYPWRFFEKNNPYVSKFR